MSRGAALRVKAAEAAFEEAHDALVEWEEDHKELMKEYQDLVDARESAREKLELAVSDTGIAAGGMRVVKVNKRFFDAERLFLLIGDEKLRDAIIERKVNTKALDKAVKDGQLDPSIAEHCTTFEQQMQIKKKPTKIVLG